MAVESGAGQPMNDAVEGQSRAGAQTVGERLSDHSTKEPCSAAPKPSNAGPRSRPDVALVVPIFNDFVSFTQLCREVDQLLADWGVELSVIGVDDGSMQSASSVCFDPPLANIERVRLVKLACNLGHQRDRDRTGRSLGRRRLRCGPGRGQ